MTESCAGGAIAAPLSMRAAANLTSVAVRAARQLLTDLKRGHRIDATVLRRAVEVAFGASDPAGAWNWNTAYNVCVAATAISRRKFGPAMRAKAGSAAVMLAMLARIASCPPTHTWRSEDGQSVQPFSTPIPLALATCAAAITPSDRALEPDAGTDLLAILLVWPSACCHRRNEKPLSAAQKRQRTIGANCHPCRRQLGLLGKSCRAVNDQPMIPQTPAFGGSQSFRSMKKSRLKFQSHPRNSTSRKTKVTEMSFGPGCCAEMSPTLRVRLRWTLTMALSSRVG